MGHRRIEAAAPGCAGTGARRKGMRRRAAVLLASALAMPGCSTLGSLRQTFLGGQSASDGTQRLTGFIGSAVADEPRAALTVADYIAGMTDRFALDEHRRLTDPFTIG